MSAALTLFLAPTAREARHAAWQLVSENHLALGTARPNLLDPPLIFTGAGGALEWRDLARADSVNTAVMPRLGRAEAFFSRFYASISRFRPLSGADRLWVLQSAARRAFGAGTSPQEAERLQKPEFLTQFAHQIAALRDAHLSRFPDVEGAAELNDLLRAYDARLAALGGFDFEAAPALFAFSATQNRAFAWPHTLVVDGLLDPSPALQIGMDALFERARCVAGTLFCPGGAENDAALHNALEFWESRGARIVRTGDFGSKKARAAARILGAQTSDEAKTCDDAEPAPTDLFLTPAHTPREEMERIAAHLRTQIEAGHRPDDFCLALADMGAYEADARHVFASYGVPLDWPRPRALERSPLVRALLRADRSCQTALGVHELHDLFGDGTLRLQSEERIFDARRLRAAALAAGHTELDDLQAARAAFERKRALFTQNPRHDNEAARTRIETSLLAGDLELVAAFETLRAPFCQPSSAIVWQNQILELTRQLAGHWTEIGAENGVSNEAATRAQQDLARWELAIEQVVERARSWDDEAQKRGAGEWQAWLEWEIAFGAENAPDSQDENQQSGVRAVSLSHFDGGARATFFCGLSERAWPASRGQNGLERELGPVLDLHQATSLVRATHVLARAMGETPALYLSHAGYISGKETPASPLLDDLKAAFPGVIWPQLPRDSHFASRRDWLVALHSSPSGEANLPIEIVVENCAAEAKNLKTLSQMRSQRRNREIGRYDGVLGPRGRDLMAARDGRSGGARLSGSDLEFYARCPIRYFFERVLQLRFEERGDGDLDAREAGNLVHEIARAFIKSWKTPLQSEDFEAALQMLSEITRNECEKLPLRPILREAEWHRLMGADGSSGPLAQWLKLEISQGSGAWGREMRPFLHSQVQLNGVSDGLEHRFEIEIGGHKIKGFIDRLDVNADGAQISVIDYKTGNVAGLPSWKAGDSGLHFQLAIYALAVRQLTDNLGQKPQLAMAYLSLRRAQIARGIGQEGTLGRGCSGGKMLGDDEFDAWLEDARSRAIRIADLRGRGIFNISLQSAKDAKCASCPSKTLCGQHAETQAARIETHRSSPFFYAPALREWNA